MRPHRQPRHDRSARQGTQEEDTYDQYDYTSHGHRADNPARSTQRSRHDSRGNCESRNNGMGGYGHSNRYQASEGRDGYGGGTSWRPSMESDYHERDRAYTRRRQQGYQNHPNRNYDYDRRRDSNHGDYDGNYEDTNRSRGGRYSRNNYNTSYERNRNSDQGPYRANYREQRRGYHSSTSRYNSSTGNESGSGRLESNSTPSLASRLFQHRDSVTRIDPVRSIRNNRRAPPPNLNMPTRESLKKMGPDEDYLKASLETSRGARSATEGEEAGVDVQTLVRKLLVLDLNGTLVYRSPHRSWRERNPAHGTTASVMAEEDVYAQFDPSQPRPLRSVHPRPYLSSFREYLFHPSTKLWLDTMVWSSAQPHSVNDMVQKCFGDKKGGLVAIWARDRLGLSNNDYGRKVQTTKDLNKPWEELNSTSFKNPSLATPSPPKRNHSARTTLLLDDSPLKAHLQPYNHLCLKEYDFEMRKHDIAVRELEVARVKLADVIAGKKGIEDILRKPKFGDENGDGPDDINTAAVEVEGAEHPDSAQAEEEVGMRKRKRKEKKENRKKERIEEQLKKLTDENQNPDGVYDETLLAVIGVLDTVKTENNVAAWVRSGGLIQSLVEGDDSGVTRELSVNSESSAPSVEKYQSPKKKIKFSEGQVSPPSLGKDAAHEDSTAGGKECLASVASDNPPPPTSSPPRASSPAIQDEKDALSETERTGVPLDDSEVKGTEDGAKSVERQLWFDHPGTLTYWASRGRKALEDMKINIVADVVGPTG